MSESEEGGGGEERETRRSARGSARACGGWFAGRARGRGRLEGFRDLEQEQGEEGEEGEARTRGWLRVVVA